MTDDPFKTRPEDFINRGLRAAVGQLPVVGGPLGEFITFVIGDPSQERRDDFMRELYARISVLAEKMEQASNENLHQNVPFQATFIQATQIAMRTVQDEKRAMLRNAVLNTAVGTVEENTRLMFMQFIERFTPLHVAMLALLDNPAGNKEAKERANRISMGGSLGELVNVAIPALANQREFASVIAADLEATKLVNGAGLRVMMTAGGLGASRSTELGKAFLKFVSDPENASLPA